MILSCCQHNTVFTKRQQKTPLALQTPEDLTKQYHGSILKDRKGAASRRLAPKVNYFKEVTAGWEAGRLLLFAVMYLQEQAANADDNQTELKQLRIRQHGHPLLSSEGQEVPSGMERPTACRYRQR